MNTEKRARDPRPLPAIKGPGDLTALPVTNFVVDLGVAGTAKAHQVLSCMGAALGDRLFVVYLFSRDKATFLLATLTERVL